MPTISAISSHFQCRERRRSGDADARSGRRRDRDCRTPRLARGRRRPRRRASAFARAQGGGSQTPIRWRRTDQEQLGRARVPQRMRVAQLLGQLGGRAQAPDDARDDVLAAAAAGPCVGAVAPAPRAARLCLADLPLRQAALVDRLVRPPTPRRRRPRLRRSILGRPNRPQTLMAMAAQRRADEPPPELGVSVATEEERTLSRCASACRRTGSRRRARIAAIRRGSSAPGDGGPLPRCNASGRRPRSTNGACRRPMRALAARGGRAGVRDVAGVRRPRRPSGKGQAGNREARAGQAARPPGCVSERDIGVGGGVLRGEPVGGVPVSDGGGVGLYRRL
jgi:hypothetical protein